MMWSFFLIRSQFYLIPLNCNKKSNKNAIITLRNAHCNIIFLVLLPINPLSVNESVIYCLVARCVIFSPPFCDFAAG